MLDVLPGLMWVSESSPIFIFSGLIKKHGWFFAKP
ncbi:hypothetical protein CFU_1756 [Collimonas fungivorans Ter331]|uniref:Uncharacterized protein n=1 Tax=Collimonas fungivorans (strain Ter331) TaxID=1005048 RepID=G0ABM2_COLFT|nr:hypothetical protein CFU_1756 [Collimonas fungivorans Ter331]